MPRSAKPIDATEAGTSSFMRIGIVGIELRQAGYGRLCHGGKSFWSDSATSSLDPRAGFDIAATTLAAKRFSAPTWAASSVPPKQLTGRSGDLLEIRFLENCARDTLVGLFTPVWRLLITMQSPEREAFGNCILGSVSGGPGRQRSDAAKPKT